MPCQIGILQGSNIAYKKVRDAFKVSVDMQQNVARSKQARGWIGYGRAIDGEL